jgi:hypothetical protein
MPSLSWKELMNAADEGTKEFELLAPDTYSFVIKDAAKVGQTSKGNPKFTINPSVEAGPRQNARVFHDFSVSESPYAMKNFFFGDLATLGLGPEFFDSNPTPEQIGKALQGRRFVAEVFHEVSTSNGKTYARLRNFGPPVGSAPAAAGQVGVPAGLPSAPAPVAASVPGPAAPAAPQVQNAAPAAPVAPASPWETAAPAAPTAPAAPFGSNVPMPPPFPTQQ